MPFNARPHVLHETNLADLRKFAPNLAVLPWGATEAHGYHLPYGTDVIEAVALGERAVAQANALGGKCLLLPAIPFGIDHTQLDQVATITMRARTQQAILEDIALSLTRQGIDRLVVLNFHGGNEFKSIIRDVMLDYPIFIAQIHGFQTAPETMKKLFDYRAGDHADEFETSLLLHLAPDWVTDHSTWGSGQTTPSQLKHFSSTPGTWAPRQWSAYAPDTGSGDPAQSTAEKGKAILHAMSERIAAALADLSKAKPGQFPFNITAPKT